jgi:hypothetical protein
MINRMSYLYKKPTKRSSYGKASIDEVIEVNEVIIPEILEKVDVIGSHITEISYEEHLKNLELMCKKDREFMKRVRLFCEENKEENFPHVSESANESTSEHGNESE